MLMVLLLGVSACVSLFFIYKNKHKITFELLKYYTYLDEYLSRLDKTKSKDTLFLYPNNGNLSESIGLKTSLVNLKSSPLNYLITKDFLVLNADESTKHSKTFYTIFKIGESNNEDDAIKLENTENIEETFKDRNVVGEITPIDFGVNYASYEEKLNDIIFNNQMKLLQNIEWSPEIIAASITIVDSQKIHTFREYDITDFFISLSRQDGIIELNNEKNTKILWIYIFNYVFKNKHVTIPIESDILKNLTISWNIVLSDCSILEGETIRFDMKNH